MGIKRADERTRTADLISLRVITQGVAGGCFRARAIEVLLDRFNIFEAIGFVGQELMHSRFLAFLLDPSKSHGLGDLLLKRLLRETLAADT
jgi:PD-(D/E)XK nuclease superfamily protein